jgi:hypothetical protein
VKRQEALLFLNHLTIHSFHLYKQNMLQEMELMLEMVLRMSQEQEMFFYRKQLFLLEATAKIVN